MFRRLRARLTAWYLSILALALVLFGFGTLLSTRTLLVHNLDVTNRQVLRPSLERFASREDSLTDITHELDELALEPGEHLAVLTPKGKVRFSRGVRLDREPPLVVGSSWHGGPTPLRIYIAPLRQNGEVKGYLRIGRSLDAGLRAMRLLAWTMAAMVPLVLLVAWAGGRWLSAKAVQPVEAAMERERQFTRDASHELRTPLTVILTQAQLAMEQPDLAPSVRSKLGVIETTARKMRSLVEDLLTLGRGDAGLHGSTLRFSLLELVEDELEALAPLAQERGLAFDLAPPSDGRWVEGDPGRLGQVVRNLLDNALRYGQAPIRVSFGPDPDAVTLRVSNAGPPLSATDRERLFDRFYRAEAGRARNPEGTGLGLAIARAIARAHHGDLTVHSEAGTTAFTLRLPRAKAQT
ncbi:MAG TPA: HAMP domain-containing sensor histidine kinase [Stenomitos sp.]